MKLEEYGRFTVIMRGYSFELADGIIEVLCEYKDDFVVEITLNSEGALDTIRRLTHTYKNRIHIGAGTVKTLYDAENAVAAGAEFLLSPIGFTKEMMDYCKEKGVIAIPAAMTPSEIETQFHLGADIVKVFPARTVGAKFFKDVQAPLGKLKLMAVGGVGMGNYQEYFDNDCQYVGMGSGMFGALDINTASDDQLRSVFESYLDGKEKK